jgi:hypothetical protein
MFYGIWVVPAIQQDYDDDKAFQNISIVVLLLAVYNLISSLALGAIMVTVAIISIIISTIIFFPCIVFCHECITWKPVNDGDVDRVRFLSIIKGKDTEREVLIFIFKNRKRKFGVRTKQSKNLKQNKVRPSE